MVTEEVKIGSSTLENFLAIFTEIKLYLPYEPIILLLFTKKNESLSTPKDLHENVYSSFFS